MVMAPVRVGTTNYMMDRIVAVVGEWVSECILLIPRAASYDI